MSLEFSNKVVVITGGGGVLCRTMAKALAEKGARIAILDLRAENAGQVADEIAQVGGEAISLAANVLNMNSLQSARQRGWGVPQAALGSGYSLQVRRKPTLKIFSGLFTAIPHATHNFSLMG